MKKLSMAILPVFVLSVLVGFLAGCGGTVSEKKSATPAVSTTVEEKDKDYVVKVGYYPCDHMTAAPIAKDSGIYDELGLKVELTGNGKVPEAMAAGQMDVGYVGTEGVMRAFLKGSPIVIAANNHLGGAYYLVASNNISDPKDLVGKKVALGTDPEKTSSSWIQIANFLKLPVEGKNYQTFDMADKDEFFALRTGKLDGYTCCDPWASRAEYEKAGRILATDSKLPNGEWGSCCAFTVNQKFAKEHPELAKKMILAHSKAIEFIYSHPVRTAEIFSKNYNQPVEVALRTIHKKTVVEGRTLTWKIDLKNFENEINYEKSVGTLESAPKTSDFIKTELLDQSGVDDFDTFIKEKVDPIFPVGKSFDEWKKKAYEIDL